MGSFPFPRNGIIKLDYEFILIFKKMGATPPVSKDIKEQSRLTTEEWNTYFHGHWNFPGDKQKKHLAMFPEELPKRLIRMFTFVGETVLDPFLGSGTTSLAAKNLERNSLGYEINEDFLPVIKEKLGLVQGAIFANSHVQIDHQDKPSTNYEAEIAALPYIFHDPIHFDKKCNPKENNYGSRLDLKSPQRQDYFRVKDILSPTLLRLNSGQRIRLLGLKERPENNPQALAYLQETLKNTQVYFKEDGLKHDQDVPYVYLYLRNKTFINAQMIKKGLAEPDQTQDHKKKAIFQRYFDQAIKES
jgi:site-specific DNA-methyltransferase (adenine-specific)